MRNAVVNNAIRRLMIGKGCSGGAGVDGPHVVAVEVAVAGVAVEVTAGE